MRLRRPAGSGVVRHCVCSLGRKKSEGGERNKAKVRPSMPHDGGPEYHGIGVRCMMPAREMKSAN